MCDICDGRATHEDALDDIADKIATAGYAVQFVEPDHRMTGWGYTIGLTESSNHPELVIVGSDPDVATVVLHTLAMQIRDGDRLRPGDWREPAGVAVELAAVHPVHLKHGVFNMWLARYGWLPEPPSFEALEVVLPTPGYCAEHRRFEPALADHTARLYGRFPNRAARRARQRRRR